eukprot:m.565509 g.565509  ORF g.565509 m.565509 type:complete len:113 (-) comp57825_c0_seq15:58-396(-)
MEWTFLFLFMLALGECALLAYNWSAGSGPVFRLVAIYLASITFIFVMVHYTKVLLRHHHQRQLLPWVVYPVSFIVAGLFTGALIWSLITLNTDDKLCIRQFHSVHRLFCPLI